MRQSLRFAFSLLALCTFAVFAQPALVLCAHSARADQTDPKLPALFDQLKNAPDEDTANEIEFKIWSIWLDSGDKAIDNEMTRAIEAMQAGDTASALAAFNDIIMKKPDWAEAWNKRATLYYEMGEYQKSLDDIAATLKLEPRHFGAISGAGLVDAELERYEDSVAAFKHMLEIDPQSSSAKRNIDAIEEIIKKKSI